MFDFAERTLEGISLTVFAMAAYMRGEAVGFFNGDRPDWQKRLAIVVSTLTIASFTGFAFLGLAALTTDLRELPGIVAEHRVAGPLPELREMVEQAIANDDSILHLLKADICERNMVPQSRCNFWLANGRPDNLRRDDE